MASQECRDAEYRAERAQARHQAHLSRLGPEYWDDEPEEEVSEEERYERELDAYYDEMAVDASYRIICDGPEMDEPVVIEVF